MKYTKTVTILKFIKHRQSQSNLKAKKNNNQYWMGKFETKKKRNTNYSCYVHVRLEESVAMEIRFIFEHTLRLLLKVENETNDSYLSVFFVVVCFLAFFLIMSKKINKNDRRHCQSAMLNRQNRIITWFNKCFIRFAFWRRKKKQKRFKQKIVYEIYKVKLWSKFISVFKVNLSIFWAFHSAWEV